MVTGYDGMDPDSSNDIIDELDEDTEDAEAEDALEQASTFRRDPSERRFRLFHLLSANELPREDIFERLGDYYQIHDNNDPAVGLSSQRAKGIQQFSKLKNATAPKGGSKDKSRRIHAAYDRYVVFSYYVSIADANPIVINCYYITNGKGYDYTS